MAKPGDVRVRTGWTEIIAYVDENGQPTGGYLVPPGNDELIKELMAFIKEEIHAKHGAWVRNRGEWAIRSNK